MTLVRWSSFHGLTNWQRHLDGWPCERAESSVREWSPAVDVVEKDGDLIVRAELPGVSADDIDVRVENDTLVIRGERKRDEAFENGKTYRRERSYGAFLRRFSLPATVDGSRIAASYTNGVLEVTLPESEEAKPRKIEIAAA